MDTGGQATEVRGGAREQAERPAVPFRVTLPFSERRLLLFTIDALLVNAAVLAALWAWQRLGGGTLHRAFLLQHWLWFPFFTAAWWGLGWLFDLYEINLAGRRFEVTKQIGLAFSGFVVLYLFIFFLAPRESLPRLFFLLFMGFAALLLLLWRWAYATLFALPELQQHVLVVGAGGAGRTFVEMLREQESNIYQVVGFVDDDPDKQDTEIAGVPVLGDSRQLLQLVVHHRVDKIVLAITNEMPGALFQALIDCRAKGYRVVFMPDLYQQLTRRVPVEHVNEGWVLNAMNGFTAVSRLEELAYRGLDIFFGILGVIGLGLLLPFVALAVALDDGGDLFYTQIRSGRAGVPFYVIKLRTMRPDAEKDGKPQWAKKGDDRVTHVGKVLRKTRLDELPQVINVLRGDMHIVGPRPERPEFIAELEEKIPFYRTRLTVKPGLTGWAQVRYRYGNSVEDALMKLQYDLYYIRHRSPWMDLYIIFKTFGVMLRLQGV